jgi:uncharacterized membrane-anchored protein YitT (DUF2179 family)
MANKTKNKINSKSYVISNLLIGNVIMGFAYSVFTLPTNIVTGGSGGLGVILRGLFGFDPAIVVTAFLWFMFIIGFFTLGKEFAIKTLPSTVIYPLSIFLFNNIEPLQVAALTIDNQLISAIFSGALFGVGVAFVFRVGGSSGGMDVISFLISKYFKISFEKVIFMLDLVVITAGIFFVGLEPALVGIIVSFITMSAIDRVVFGGSETMMIYIMSNQHKKINDYIINNLKRGTTIIPSFGGFTNEEKRMLQVVISRSDYYIVQKNIVELDPDAFITVLNAQEVIGKGFSTSVKK